MAEKKFILLVEDDKAVADIIIRALQIEEYQIINTTSVAESMKVIENINLCLALLDFMLPDGESTQLMPELNAKSVPFVIVSQKNNDDDVINGLRGGAVDYIRKPFNPQELRLRIQGILERQNYKKNPIEEVIKFNNQDREAYVIKKEKVIHLSDTEFQILHCLYESRGQFIPVEELYHKVWGAQPTENYRKVVLDAIRGLRKKIEPDFSRPTYIINHWGQGYCFTDAE